MPSLSEWQKESLLLACKICMREAKGDMLLACLYRQLVAKGKKPGLPLARDAARPRPYAVMPNCTKRELRKEINRITLAVHEHSPFELLQEGAFEPEQKKLVCTRCLQHLANIPRSRRSKDVHLPKLLRLRVLAILRLPLSASCGHAIIKLSPATKRRQRL